MFVPVVGHYDRLCTPGGRSGLSFDGLESYSAPTLSASARFGGFGHFSQPSSPQPHWRCLDDSKASVEAFLVDLSRLGYL